MGGGWLGWVGRGMVMGGGGGGWGMVGGGGYTGGTLTMQDTIQSYKAN